MLALALALQVSGAWPTPPGTPSTPSARAASLDINPDYNPNSPHWSHINVLDFGRAARSIPDNTLRAQALNWYARHVDVIESEMDNTTQTGPNTQSTYFHSLNPTLKTFGYDYDLTMCQNAHCNQSIPTPHPLFTNLPEDYYLHFSEDTQLEFRDLNGQAIETVNISGCPEPQALTSSCRMQIFVWTQKRWVSNLQNSAWRQATADRFLQQLQTNSAGQPNIIDGLFLDEHGPGIFGPLGFGHQVIILSGGGIREYAGQRPDDSAWPAYTQLDQDYTTDMIGWLTYLRSRLEAAGKFLHINVAEYFTDSLTFTTALAAKGGMTEHLNRADSNGLSSAAIYQTLLGQIRQITQAGGSVDLAGSPCNAGPVGFAPGNYATGAERYRMWSLASYYLAKEVVGDPGKVYFNPNLCVDYAGPNPMDFVTQWLAAYEVNVGLPVGEATVFQQGTVSCAGTGYRVLGRQFEHALVLLRPRDAWGCNTFGDNTAVTVPLDGPRQMLKPDGTRSANIDSISLRNGEAVILFPAPDTTAPGTILDLSTI
ncbi:MAG: hypothetical protein HY976_03550 [Candidatus Kerfeldbacteria bacterium]|nr:hypothetical protein [Candidatus Kerfeldbacteria bacterium]